MNSIQIEDSVSGVPNNDISALRSLMSGVIHQAILDYRRGAGASYYQSAMTWLSSERTDYPFSFVNICEYLDINPVNARRKIGLIKSEAV